MSGKAKIVIQKLTNRKGIARYRVSKLINTRRLSLMEQVYEEDELKNILNSLPSNYDYQINNHTIFTPSKGTS